MSELVLVGEAHVLRAAHGALVFGVVLLLVLKQLFDQYVELFSKGLNGILGVLPELLAVFNLSLEQFSQLLVVIFQLLALQGFAKDIFSIVAHALLVLSDAANRADHATAGADACSSRVLLTDVVEDQVPQVFYFLDVLHESFVVFVHHILGFLFADEHVFQASKR